MKVKIALLNIKGRKLGDLNKWMHIPQIMREKRIGIMAIQETHLTDKLAEPFETLFNNNFSLKYSPDPLTHNMRGVTIILNMRLINMEKISTINIIPGRALLTKIPWHDKDHLNVLTYMPQML